MKRRYFLSGSLGGGGGLSFGQSGVVKLKIDTVFITDLDVFPKAGYWRRS